MSFVNRAGSLKFSLLLIAVWLGLVFPVSADPQIQQIYSWKENVIVYPSGLVFKAKLDSGAKTSSINAVEIEEFKRDDDEWARFTIENEEEEKATIERPIVRHVRIKEHDGDFDRRPVVKLGICMGKMYKEVEVNLVDRSHYIASLLIGRTYMEDDVLIDPASTYSHPPDCNRKSADDDDN